jgi:hypothetical protein
MLKMSQKQQAAHSTTSDPSTTVSTTGATISSEQLSELFDTINQLGDDLRAETSDKYVEKGSYELELSLH